MYFCHSELAEEVKVKQENDERYPTQPNSGAYVIVTGPHGIYYPLIPLQERRLSFGYPGNSLRRFSFGLTGNFFGFSGNLGFGQTSDTSDSKPDDDEEQQYFYTPFRGPWYRPKPHA